VAHQITPHLVRLCGWKSLHTVASLPPCPGGFYPDAALVAAIHRQLQLLDWSYDRLGIAVGTRVTFVKAILERLLQDPGKRMRQRRFLQRACDLLGIICYRFGQVPETCYLSTGDRLEDAAQLGTLLTTTRRRLCYTRSEWARFVGIARKTLVLLEGLADLDRPLRRRILQSDALVRSLEKALSKSHITFDPFHHLTAQSWADDLSAAEVSDRICADLSSCLVSIRRLARASGNDAREVRYTLDHHYAARHPTVRRLGLLLRYRPPAPSQKGVRGALTFAGALSHHGLSDVDAGDVLGCDLEDVWSLRRGDKPHPAWRDGLTLLTAPAGKQDLRAVITAHREQALHGLHERWRQEAGVRRETLLSGLTAQPDAIAVEPAEEEGAVPASPDLAVADLDAVMSAASLPIMGPGLRR
jgi:hypothetical protein